MWLSFLSTIYHVFLPISFPVIGGALLRRIRKLDTKPISSLSLYVLCPALIFESLLKAQISLSEISETVVFYFINIAVLLMISILLGKWLSLPSSERSALTLIAILTNGVNYGLPLALLAFGQAGLDKASVYVILQIIVTNTLGVYVAARSHFTMKRAVRSVLSMPSLYAALAAVILRLLHVHLPDAVDHGFKMMSDSYAPVVLAILGAQMAGIQKVEQRQFSRAAFWMGIAIRLLAAPLVASAILFFLPVHGTLYSVMLLLSSMPAAVNAVILAEEFNAAPKLVSKCILWTTLASFLVLPLVIKIAQSH